MPDMLQRGLARLTQVLTDRGSQTVKYVRGSRAFDVHATFGQKMLKLDNGVGTSYVQWTDMDFLIPTEDLVISGETITPDRGDLIEITFTDKIERYEVSPYGDEPPWRYSDPNQTIVRIHTKHFETMEPI